KIRVSVVATGIDQTAEQLAETSRPLSLGKSRGPVRPVALQSVAQPEPQAATETEQARSAKEEPSIPEAYEPKLENATDPEPLDPTVEEEPAVANGADAPAQDADEEEEYDESDQAESAYGSLSGLR